MQRHTVRNTAKVSLAIHATDGLNIRIMYYIKQWQESAQSYPAIIQQPCFKSFSLSISLA